MNFLNNSFSVIIYFFLNNKSINEQLKVEITMTLSCSVQLISEQLLMKIAEIGALLSHSSFALISKEIQI